ncbi:MAG: hypothetical protein QXL51_01430 [Candidatus Aenigmatarchaeota archaeon]
MEVEKFSVATAKWVTDIVGEEYNNLYRKFKDKTLSERDFYESFSRIQDKMLKKLRELKEVNHLVRLKEVLHLA